jgi:imidazolonepropionase-like amidohydrolase
MAQAAAAQLRAGVTTVRDLGDRDYLALRLRETRTGLPTIVAAGPPITSAGGHCHFLGGVAERGVRDAVREHAERGVDVIKVMASGGFLTSGTDVDGRQFTPDDLAALVDEAHRHGLWGGWRVGSMRARRVAPPRSGVGDASSARLRCRCARVR